MLCVSFENTRPAYQGMEQEHKLEVLKPFEAYVGNLQIVLFAKTMGCWLYGVLRKHFSCRIASFQGA